MKLLSTSEQVFQDDHFTLPEAQVHDIPQASLANTVTTPKLEGDYKHDVDSSLFLAAPLAVPLRPLSPDAISYLSADEFEQIHSARRLSQAEITSPEPKGWRSKIHAFWIRNKGLAYMLIAQVFGTLMNVTTRLLEVEGNHGKGLHPFQVLFARMGITFMLASTYMWIRKTPHFPLGMPEVRWLLVARGFGGFFGVFGMYFALLYLPLADATVITFLAPGLACWACSILIKDPFTLVERVGTFVSFLGVIFIARPTTLFQAFGKAGDVPAASMNGDTTPGAYGANASSVSDASNYDSVTPVQRLTAVGISLLGVCGTVVAFTTIRWIGKRAHPLITVNYFAGWCVIVSTIMQLILPDVGFLLPTSTKEWGYLIFLGTCGFVMQYLLAAGLAYEKSSRATNMTYTQMLFALGADKLIFGHSPTILSIVGSSLILGSAIVVALQKGSGQAKENPAGGTSANDESQTGLLRDVETGEDHDRMPVQEVQMRTLR